MSVLEQIRKLDEQKAQLLQGARQEALSAAEAAIKTLRELGFEYRLVQEGTTRAPSSGSGRRTGIRDQVLAAVQANPGLTRSQLLDKLEARSDKSATQSVSNALSALKKAGTVTADGGKYKAK